MSFMQKEKVMLTDQQYQTLLDNGTITVEVEGVSITLTYDPTVEYETPLPTIPNVVDNLTSDSSTDALSAKQGKALNTSITAVATSVSTLDGVVVKVEAQTLTDAQKQQARTNIGAGVQAYMRVWEDE